MRRAPAAAMLLALAFAAAPAHAPDSDPATAVDVLVLTRWHPRAATLAGPATARLATQGETLLVDGVPHAGALALPRGRWSVALDDGTQRTYDAALRVSAAGGELRLVVSIELEEYVARAVAGETLAGTPPAALRAQAIVARSYALAGERRHDGAALCDLAHCQALTPAADPAHAAAARQAAEATHGQVLRLASGEMARPVFHACCGGTTADPRAVFGGEETTGARSARDPGCSGGTWTAAIPLAEVEAVARTALGAAGTAGGVAFDRLELVHGPEGHLLRVVDRATGRWAAGDAVARELDRAQGWSVVKSARFEWRRDGGGVLLTGHGHGHGVGLCQRGAADRARRGATAEEILGSYFAARLGEVRTSPASRFPGAAGSAAPTRSGPSPRGSTAVPPRAP